MPKEEVWVKLGGDHGGGSLKLSLQIANTFHANAVRKTIPFLVFAAPDSVDNLATTIKPYTAQVEQLQSTMWEDKVIRCIFLVTTSSSVCVMVYLVPVKNDHASTAP